MLGCHSLENSCYFSHIKYREVKIIKPASPKLEYALPPKRICY